MITDFDYIVIGAGSAGCVVANRLSADPKIKVALIEAGSHDISPWIHIPIGYFKTMGNPKFDWRYHTEKDPGLNNRAIAWPRGKIMGGSSSINGLLYVRGQRADYDDWAALGNKGWGADGVMPLFKNFENWELGADNWRGDKGELSTETSNVKRDIIDDWVEAAQQAGYPYNNDYNGATQEGVGYFQMTTRGSLRCSSAKAFIKPIKTRKNLTIFTNAQALKIHCENNVATGLKIAQKNRIIELKAHKEVILSAGAIGSPQLLMLSGIGHAPDLKKLGIDMVTNLKGVGQNLQDHLQARPIYKCKSSTMNVEADSLIKQFFIGLQYMLTRKGPMTMAASLGTGFLCTKHSPKRPDIQFHIQPFSKDVDAPKPHPFSAFTASVLQLRPKSAGHLKLTSNNPYDYPSIHPNYLSDKLDCDTLVEALKITHKITEFEPLKSNIIAPYAPSNLAQSDSEILDWARSYSTTIYHPTGTCKMGQDDLAVVDEKLKVKNIKNLRVADCSIMPQIVSGNTNAPAMMIGEKVAAMIIAERLSA